MQPADEYDELFAFLYQEFVVLHKAAYDCGPDVSVSMTWDLAQLIEVIQGLRKVYDRILAQEAGFRRAVL